jgi:hypothetical protein
MRKKRSVASIAQCVCVCVCVCVCMCVEDSRSRLMGHPALRIISPKQNKQRDPCLQQHEMSV